jgi:uncharacterized protein (DUF433 family)
MDYRDRINADPNAMLGKPTTKGTRITVELILRKLSEDAAVVDILEAYPHLSGQDILAALSDGVEARLRRHLRDGGLSVRAVREESPGLPDRDVLARAVETDSVLLNEDSDFREWIIAHREPSVGVVFVRLPTFRD